MATKSKLPLVTPRMIAVYKRARELWLHEPTGPAFRAAANKLNGMVGMAEFLPEIWDHKAPHEEDAIRLYHYFERAQVRPDLQWAKPATANLGA